MATFSWVLDVFAGKSTTFFPDFEVTPSGLQFKDFKLGAGEQPTAGDKVLVDWTGVTIGYQGRYFQTRNKPKGGAFADDGFDAECVRHGTTRTPHTALCMTCTNALTADTWSSMWATGL